MLAIIIIIHLLNVTILVSLQMSDVLDNFGKELRDMLCRTEKLEELAAENSKGIKRNSEGVECNSQGVERNSQGVERNSQGVKRNSEELQRQSEKLELHDKRRRTEDHGSQKVSKNKGIYLFTLRHELFMMHFPAEHHGQHG
jgi:hypothetical protein